MNIELLNAITLGFIGSMIPGPIISALFTEILQSGFRRGFKTIFYALIAETSIALFIVILFSFVPLSTNIFNSISIIGAVVLIWISTSLWKIKSFDSSQRISFNFSKISLLTITNGLFWTYWITVCIPKAIALNGQLYLGKYAFVGFLEIGWFTGTTLLAFIFSRFRPILLRPKVIGNVFKIFALTFIYFALDMGYRGITACL